MSKLAISFDPGVVHLGVAAVVIPEGDLPKMEWSKTWNVKGEKRSPDPILMLAMMEVIEEVEKEICEKRGIEDAMWVIEYQPPLNTVKNPGLVRMNTWVEAFLETWCRVKQKRVRIVASSAVKRKFSFPLVGRDRQYKANKVNGKKIAKALVACPKRGISEHVADCLLNGLYALTVD
jgi:hypothetical protein